jgi:hypothetical protein
VDVDPETNEIFLRCKEEQPEEPEPVAGMG